MRASSFASSSSDWAASTRSSRRLQALSDTQLAAKTVEFRARLENGEPLDDLLHEAFAVAREASVRALGMRHFDVQLIGGMVLNDGQIAEMKTGEGKTLVSTLAGYLNALPGKGVHVVTVNDYLAKRDSEWMGRIYRFLGMDVGMIQSQMDPSDAYPRLRGRRHLRHQRRVRLRLPARQHGGDVPRTACSAATTSPSSTRSTRS